MKLGLIADIQYADVLDEGCPERLTTMSLVKLRESVEILNGVDDLTAVVVLGDFIDRGRRNFQPVMEVLSDLRVPMYPVLGNHDFCGDDYDYGHVDEALDALGLTRNTKYRYIDQGDVRLVFTDTNEGATIEVKAGTEEFIVGQKYIERLASEGLVNAKPWNGAIGVEQMKWLGRVIDDAASEHMSVVVFGYDSIWPEHRENALNASEIRDLLATKSNVIAYVNGHNHDGDYGVYRGLPCVTIEGMVEGETNAFGVLEIGAGKAVIHGFGRVKSRELR